MTKTEKMKTVCPVCGKKYVYIERHMKTRHPVLPDFNVRLHFYLSGIKHIMIIHIPYTLLYMIPIDSFYKSVIAIIMGLFFIGYYIYRAAQWTEDSNANPVLAFHGPQLLVFAIFCMLFESLNGGFYEYFAEFLISLIFYNLDIRSISGWKLFKLIFSFIILLVWILGAFAWEMHILLFKKKYNKIRYQDKK